MKIETVMTKDVITLKMTDTILEAAKKMKEYDIGFLPVVQKDKIMGVITDRDIVVAAIANQASSSDYVEKYMTHHLITIDQYQSLEEALRLMGEKKVKRLLVSNQKKLAGILSLSDLINTSLSSDVVVEELKKLWEIYRNIDDYKTEIDEFYL